MLTLEGYRRGRASPAAQEFGFVRATIPLAAVLVLGAAGCGSTTTSSAPPTISVRVETTPTMALTVFRADGGTLHAEVKHVPQTQGVAAAALAALGVDAPVAISGGTATVELAKAPNDEVAGIVYTLTQFPSVQKVDVAGRAGLTRDDFAGFLDPISIEAPAAGARVPTTFHVTGTASVFEATFVVQLVRDGKVLTKQTVTASEGAPGRGAFDATFTATPGDLVVTAFAPSAADGTPQHEVDVAVTVGS
jgi:immunoglobulin-like protein involved in spore germination